VAKTAILTQELMNAFAEKLIAIHPRVVEGHEFTDSGARFEQRCQFPSTQIMPLGSYSYSLSGFSTCSYIGRYCSIGLGVRVFGDHHPIDRLSTSPVFYRRRKYAKSTGVKHTRPMVEFQSSPNSVEIGNDVWIGDDVTLRDGIRIGDGCVIATGSIVTKDVPPYTIIGGNPAKMIRRRFPDEIADMLLGLQWWQYDIHAVQSLPTENIEEFIRHAGELSEADIVPEQRFSLSELLAQSV
jgi:acetyltransferase-like isoleucine patch superfamily enzyme